MLWRENFSTSLFSVRSRERALRCSHRPAYVVQFSLSRGLCICVIEWWGKKRKANNIIPFLCSPLLMLFLCYLLKKRFQHTRKTEVRELFVYGFLLNVFDHFFLLRERTWNNTKNSLCDVKQQSFFTKAKGKANKNILRLRTRSVWVLRQTTCPFL